MGQVMTVSGRLSAGCLAGVLGWLGMALPAAAEPPDFGLSIDVGPTSIIDPRTGFHDPYTSISTTGVMSGGFDNGLNYIVSGDIIAERHFIYPAFDLNYLRFSGQLNRATDLGRIRLRATNTAVFDREFSGLLYNLVDVSLGIDRSVDLTDDIGMRLAGNVARRISTVPSLDRYSVNPSVGLSFQVFGLDAYASASYSLRTFVFRDRLDHYFGTSLSLSKTYGDLTLGVSASYDATRSSIRALSGDSITIGPTLSYNVPID